ncbi:uncharacterized protein RHOBADRAFT_56005, partial [Rhodotorula graminis WP1]
ACALAASAERRPRPGRPSPSPLLPPHPPLLVHRSSTFLEAHPVAVPPVDYQQRRPPAHPVRRAALHAHVPGAALTSHAEPARQGPVVALLVAPAGLVRRRGGPVERAADDAAAHARPLSLDLVHQAPDPHAAEPRPQLVPPQASPATVDSLARPRLWLRRRLVRGPCRPGRRLLQHPARRQQPHVDGVVVGRVRQAVALARAIDLVRLVHLDRRLVHPGVARPRLPRRPPPFRTHLAEPVARAPHASHRPPSPPVGRGRRRRRRQPVLFARPAQPDRRGRLLAQEPVQLDPSLAHAVDAASRPEGLVAGRARHLRRRSQAPDVAPTAALALDVVRPRGRVHRDGPHDLHAPLDPRRRLPAQRHHPPQRRVPPPEHLAGPRRHPVSRVDVHRRVGGLVRIGDDDLDGVLPAPVTDRRRRHRARARRAVRVLHLERARAVVRVVGDELVEHEHVRRRPRGQAPPAHLARAAVAHLAAAQARSSFDHDDVAGDVASCHAPHRQAPARRTAPAPVVELCGGRARQARRGRARQPSAAAAGPVRLDLAVLVTCIPYSSPSCSITPHPACLLAAFWFPSTLVSSLPPSCHTV